MNELIISYIRPTANATRNNDAPTINFSALIKAAQESNAWRFDIYEIYANVSSFLYWTAIKNAQRQGVTTANVQLISSNRISFTEKTEYVENRIQSALSKVIRLTCHLNYELKRHGLALCLNRKLEKTDCGMYKLGDARSIAMEIAENYENKIGKHILETNWWVAREDL